MRSIWVGILALSHLIIVLPAAHAQGGARSLGDLLRAPVGHPQPTVQKVQDIQENSSANQAMKKIDEDLQKRLQECQVHDRTGGASRINTIQDVLVRRRHGKRIIDPDAERIGSREKALTDPISQLSCQVHFVVVRFSTTNST
jgi:hypothetical protein